MSEMMSFDEAQKVFESYWNEARELDYVIDKVAWALYQTWREAEKRRYAWVRNYNEVHKMERRTNGDITL